MADEEEYLHLKDLKIGLDHESLEGESDFSLCLWLYLSASARPSSIIIRQMLPEGEIEVPFLALNKENKLSLFPLMLLHKEAPSLGSSCMWMDTPHICTEIDCQREKWVHIGCELSSKSDNRLFLVCFHTTGAQKYPFLEAYSRPIRCISRNRTVRPSIVGRRPFSTSPLVDENHSPGGNDRSHASRDANRGGPFRVSSRSDLKCSPSLKRFKVGPDISSSVVDANGVSKQDDSISKKSVEIKSNEVEGTDSAPSDSESTDVRNSESTWEVHAITPISDTTIFRYCLESMPERTMLLKEIINSSSNEDIANFAEQVCLYAGCSHHRYQILMSKQLIKEGTNTWNSISGNCHSVLWRNAVPEINKRFMRISRSTTRSLSGKDMEVLREIAGCGEDLSHENFEKMWYWLYPVAFSLSKNCIYNLWECVNPLWIEGFITKEEAENSLRGPKGPQNPGTFILRFPTSRSWPHPDAGNLVITYIGADSTLHHKLLSLDLSYEDNGEGHSKQLKALLLEEPELSQLGRVTRHGVLSTRAEGQV